MAIHVKSGFMKFRILLFIVTLLSLSLCGYGQKTTNPSGIHNEVYFSFKVGSKDELKPISRQISIDNFRNDTVWAYANRQQFERFSGSGYTLNILPHPGDGPGVVMRDQIDLKRGTRTTWNFYPTYPAYEALMYDFQAMYPDLCQIQTITTLPSGRKILVAKISDNVAIDEAEPEFLYTSSMHGDETTGYVLMLHLIEYLLQNYGTNPEATELVNNMEIYINPLANPDGTYYGGNNSVSGARRSNINGVDLNRNYPDPEDGDHPDGNAWQPETIGFMNFASQRDFVAAANFHGGAEVVNYPWDTWATRSADDNWWQFVSREYADTVHLHAPSTYMRSFNNGITNGYDWYEVDGGRQDYMNYFHHCREFTIEISNTKLLPAAQLPAHWNYNYRSLILFMKQATYGFRGLVSDLATGLPVEAKISLIGHDNNHAEVYATALHGDYYRPVKAGTYTVEVSAPCYISQSFPNQSISDYNTLTLNVQLVSSAGVSTTAVTSVTGNSAVSGGEILCEGSSPITGKGVCWSTTINPTLSDAHTSDGVGTDAFVSYISGLSASTAYYVRAYATNAEGTVYGNNVQFTTSCGSTSLPFTEYFNATTFPACWSTSVTGTGVVPNWSVSNTTNAGGNAHEMLSTWQNKNPASTRLVSPPINTSGQTLLNLSFRHMLDAYGTGATLKVQSSTDGINWNDEDWSVATTTTNIPASIVNTTIANNLNSANTYIAFTVTGNLYQYDYWYIDNILVTGTFVPTLTVTPPNQEVSSAASSAVYAVESNTGWVASSDQPWCVVTPSGNGNGTITAAYEDNSSASPRVAMITVSAAGLDPVTVSLSQEGVQERLLNLTLYIEGLFNGSGMNKAQNENGDQFADEIADEIVVELHHADAPYTLAAGPYMVGLHTDGTAQLNIPVSLDGNYYIVIGHRNSVETWSSAPVSFSGSTVGYNFTDAASRAFGNNLKLMSGKYVIYSGDVNQDGVVDSADMTPVDNDAAVYSSGYLATDVNGDGIIDTADMTLLDNNSASYIGVIAP